MSGQPAVEITVPNVKMSFDQLLAVIRQLDEPGRALIARVLLESKMDDELRHLLLELSRNATGSTTSPTPRSRPRCERCASREPR